MGTLTQGPKTKESMLREDMVIERSKSETGPFLHCPIHTPTPVFSGKAFFLTPLQAGSTLSIKHYQYRPLAVSSLLCLTLGFVDSPDVFTPAS